MKPSQAISKKRVKPDSDVENSDPEEEDSSLSARSPPDAKKQKKAQPPKKSSKGPLEPIPNESVAMDEQDGSAVKPKPHKAPATEQYQKVIRRLQDKLQTAMY